MAVVALAITLTSCAENPPPLPPPPPPQFHVLPLNEQLEGLWSASYPGLEIIAKLATVLEVEPAELIRLPSRQPPPSV